MTVTSTLPMYNQVAITIGYRHGYPQRFIKSQNRSRIDKQIL